MEEEGGGVKNGGTPRTAAACVHGPPARNRSTTKYNSRSSSLPSASGTAAISIFGCSRNTKFVFSWIYKLSSFRSVDHINVSFFSTESATRIGNRTTDARAQEPHHSPHPNQLKSGLLPISVMADAAADAAGPAPDYGDSSSSDEEAAAGAAGKTRQ